jgi:hypothetical protein
VITEEQMSTSQRHRPPLPGLESKKLIEKQITVSPCGTRKGQLFIHTASSICEYDAYHVITEEHISTSQKHRSPLPGLESKELIEKQITVSPCGTRRGQIFIHTASSICEYDACHVITEELMSTSQKHRPPLTGLESTEITPNKKTTSPEGALIKQIYFLLQERSVGAHCL